MENLQRGKRPLAGLLNRFNINIRGRPVKILRTKISSQMRTIPKLGIVLCTRFLDCGGSIKLIINLSLLPVMQALSSW
jgi:hypothetical protein